jgi:hypothetical protein
MKFSARATVVALAACAGMGAAAQTAAATPMSPEQVGAAEKAASLTRVPFNIPLSGVVSQVTGETSGSGLHGSLPGMPVTGPPTAPRNTHDLLPDPLVPALGAAQSTPDVVLTAPAPGGDGSVSDGGLVAALPSVPMKLVGATASLGHPLTWTPSTSQAASNGKPSASGSEQLDLSRVAPTLTEPQFHSAPSGSISLDQRTMDRPIDRTVSEFLTTATATAQDLKG